MTIAKMAGVLVAAGGLVVALVAWSPPASNDDGVWQAADGKSVFKKACAECHEGPGVPLSGTPDDPKPPKLTASSAKGMTFDAFKDFVQKKSKIKGKKHKKKIKNSDDELKAVWGMLGGK